MTGIDILAAEEVAVEWAFNWTAFWIVLGIVGLIVIVLFIILTSKYGADVSDLGYAGILVLVGVILSILIGSVAQIPTEYETQYKVTISDDVLMTEFLERYEIIETEGKIYTVREK